jgi:hypothetical protein
MSTNLANMKKSPRAPSMSLNDAIERALRAYDKERLHEAPTQVVAQNLGYKNANSGTALSAIASLRYFGLLIRPKNGFLVVAKELEAYKFAPTDAQKQALLVSFLTKPPLYQDLLKKYVSGLPSDATLKYELIERGFIPAGAETALNAFKESVDFVRYFDLTNVSKESSVNEEEEFDEVKIPARAAPITLPSLPVSPLSSSPTSPMVSVQETNDEHDQIPVRLSGGRRAWLTIPMPFYEADKQRLKAQIDLLLTEDEDEPS